MTEAKEDARRLLVQVEFLRTTFRNDGAQGETVHAVCDAVERLLAGQERVVVDDAHVPFAEENLGGPSEPKPPTQVRWGYCAIGAEEDGFRGAFFTREQAIAEGRLHHCSEDFQVGMGYLPDPAKYMPSVEDILERASEAASNEGSDIDDWPEVTDEAEKELKDFLTSWARRHAPCPFWVLDHFEHVLAPPTGKTEPPPHTD